MPITQTFTASRNATWAPPLTYTYPGGALPLAGAKVAMQLRLYPGAAGDPLLAIPEIAYTDVRIAAASGDRDELRRLTLMPEFAPTQLSTLPNSGEAGDSDTFAFDILIIYADGVTEILSSGSFIVSPGVTRP
ncbi:hypothetical protein DRN02_005265 [Sphingomonas paucimobilis]|uniref:hypothetical protein n=1 Tax=Sphingomonas paucimobilis TaxID=13689 RepID=UPI001023594B|nr:hypothetical protein [Sphingomonas paucimobilis]QBE91498.1 hypothetical protein DRN02_005265 [Sphingomonas paucimobilis]